jgi:hypothetical protein
MENPGMENRGLRQRICTARALIFVYLNAHAAHAHLQNQGILPHEATDKLTRTPCAKANPLPRRRKTTRSILLPRIFNHPPRRQYGRKQARK